MCFHFYNDQNKCSNIIYPFDHLTKNVILLLSSHGRPIVQTENNALKNAISGIKVVVKIFESLRSRTASIVHYVEDKGLYKLFSNSYRV